MKSYVFYQFNCPGCNDSYTEKIERNLFARTEEHACSDKEIVIYNYNNNCNYYDYIQNLFRFNNDYLRKCYLSIKIHLIKHYLTSIHSKHQSNRVCL